MTIEEVATSIKKKVLRKAGYDEEEINNIINEVDAEKSKFTISCGRLVDEVLKSREFWEYVDEHDTEGKFSLEGILKRRGIYSEEKLAEAKRIVEEKKTPLDIMRQSKNYGLNLKEEFINKNF